MNICIHLFSRERKALTFDQLDQNYSNIPHQTKAHSSVVLHEDTLFASLKLIQCVFFLTDFIPQFVLWSL